jgi:hypothetical protein
VFTRVDTGHMVINSDGNAFSRSRGSGWGQASGRSPRAAGSPAGDKGCFTFEPSTAFHS